MKSLIGSGLLTKMPARAGISVKTEAKNHLRHFKFVQMVPVYFQDGHKGKYFILAKFSEPTEAAVKQAIYPQFSLFK